jgi:hydrogenase nickel incorporation protein HypA/HybF
MHELGIVCRLLSHVRELQAANGGGSVREIRVQLGPLSGVEAELMLSAFQQLRDRESLTEAIFIIESVELEARCRACDHRFQPLQFRSHCPRCGASEIEILQGDGVILESISLAQPLQEFV